MAPGNLVINKMKAWQGSLGISQHHGIVSPAYIVCDVLGTIYPPFLHYLLRSPAYVAHYNRISFGVRVDQWDLRYEDLKSTSVLLPERVEQIQIARYLAHIEKQTIGLIRNKRRLIALLNEEKQGIIQQAVTRGLDPDVAMKPSGVEWLGEIPAHWYFGQLRRYWEVSDCKHLTVPFVDKGIPRASVSEVRDFELNLSQSKRTTSEWYEHLVAGNRKPKRGDLVYCRNVSVGSCAIVNTDDVFALGQDVCLIRSHQQNQRFLNYLLHSPFMDYQLSRLLSR